MASLLQTSIEKIHDDTEYNFYIMVACVSFMVFMSAFYADVFIRGSWTRDSCKLYNIIYVPDSVIPPNASLKDDYASFGNAQKRYCKYGLYTGVYFLLMFYSVIAMKNFPFVMVGIQHVAIFVIITFYFLQFARPTIGVPISIIYTVFWMFSMYTPYRWVVNNTIVAMATLLTGYIQFKNFMYLQIFMWLAFVYDVYVLAGIRYQGAGSELFSFNDVQLPMELQTPKTCETLLCSLFTHNFNYELPTVFSIQLGSTSNNVYIGSGDIIIGAFAANFTFLFFKKIKHLFVIVFSFGLSVALLSQVTETPFPALLSIVPLCTVGLLVSALFSRRSMELLLDTCSSTSEHVKHGKTYQNV